MMATVLLSPDFIYRVELGDENGRLTAWELASRLSYHFWNTMPDEELFATAAMEACSHQPFMSNRSDYLTILERTLRSMSFGRLF